MKKVLSPSLGSTRRDHTTETDLLGHHFWISRQGTNGDFETFLDMFRQYDGQVDAFGIGGICFHYQIGGRNYPIRSAQPVRQAIKHSKYGDGNGIKHILGRHAVQALQDYGIDLQGKKVFQVGVIDRYGLAKALSDAGCQMMFGDLMIGLDWPIPIHSLQAAHIISALLLPIVAQIPFSWIYPVSQLEEQPPSTKYAHYYEPADIIAGDFLQVWSNLPDDLSGKIVITNTTTAHNVEELQKRNLHLLVTTTPRLGGRSFGTNVMEAVCRCLIDKPNDQITEADIQDIVERIPLKPQIHVLNE